MRPTDNIDQLIKKLQLKASADLDARVHDDIDRALATPQKSESADAKPNVWRIIMRNRRIELAAAAAMIIALLFGLPFIAKNTTNITLAGVVERIEQARAFTYTMEMTITGDMIPAGKQVIQGTTVISNEYGMKWEMNISDPNTGERKTSKVYILPDQKVMFSIMPEQKKYIRRESDFDDDLLARMRKESNDPRITIKRILDCEYAELGRSVLNGKEVEGFESTDPKFSAGAADAVKVTLWVDVATWLPVLWEMDMKMNEQTSMRVVISDFQWDTPVVASDFEPVIPEDYTALPADGYKLPSLSEEVALEGLRSLAEAAGQYPKKIDMISLMQMFGELADAGRKRDREMNLDQASKEENTKKAMDVFRQVQSLALFYATLVEDKKEPVYYGELVGPEDVGKVLLRWKTAENEYRVIFGDLSIGTFTGEQLAELEKQPPK